MIPFQHGDTKSHGNKRHHPLSKIGSRFSYYSVAIGQIFVPGGCRCAHLFAGLARFSADQDDNSLCSQQFAQLTTLLR